MITLATKLLLDGENAEDVVEEALLHLGRRRILRGIGEQEVRRGIELAVTMAKKRVTVISRDGYPVRRRRICNHRFFIPRFPITPPTQIIMFNMAGSAEQLWIAWNIHVYWDRELKSPQNRHILEYVDGKPVRRNP